MDLTTYLKETGKKAAEFSRESGISEGLISDIKNNRRAVTLETARKLEAATGTPWHEWIDPSSAEAAE